MKIRRTANLRAGFARRDLAALLIALSALTVLGIAPGRRASSSGLRVCAENLRQLGLATQLYTVDNSGQLPGCQHALPSWQQGLGAYCGTNVFRCAPEDVPAFSYALNDFLTPHPFGARQLNFSKLSSIPIPSATLLFAESQRDYQKLKLDHFHFADTAENGFTPARFKQQVEMEKHYGATGYLFPDGHLKRLEWWRVEAQLEASTSVFVRPDAGGNTIHNTPKPLIVAR